jgi:hypothetical protein
LSSRCYTITLPDGSQAIVRTGKRGWKPSEAHERRIVRCSSCRAMIIWFKTETGRNMPVDADSVRPEDEEYDPAAPHQPLRHLPERRPTPQKEGMTCRN